MASRSQQGPQRGPPGFFIGQPYQLLGSQVTPATYWVVKILGSLLLIAGLVIGITAFGLFLADQPTNIKHLNTNVNPTNNNVNLVVRTDINAGLAIQDNTLPNGAPGASSIALRNTGVLNVLVNRGLSTTGGQTPTLSNTMIAGAGISIGGTNAVPTIVNEGVIELTEGRGIAITGPQSANPTIANTMDAGVGISIGGTTAVPTIENEGILSLTPGIDIEITPSSQTPTISHTLSKRARLLTIANPLSPVVKFNSSNILLAANVWHRLNSAGITAGAGSNGVEWRVPDDGLFHIHGTCYASVNLDGFNGRTGLQVAVATSSNASITNPFAGIVPPGGHVRSDISYLNGASLSFATVSPTPAPTEAPTSSPTTAAPTAKRSAALRGVPIALSGHAISLSAAIHVCSGCSGVAVADILGVFVMIDTNGGSSDVQTVDFECRMQASQVL